MIHTDIDFPSSLPCPQREGKAVRTVQPFSRTTMTTGRAIQRRRFSSVPSMVQVSWVFNSAQAMAFEAWFRDAINDGASWFNIDIRFPAGPGAYVARFADMYIGPDQVSANHWRYGAELEIWERPLIDPGWGILPDFVAGMDIFDIAMNREWPLFIFDFETYQDALDAFDTLTDGQTITVRDVDGMHARYRVRRNTGPSISLNFADQIYFITDGPDALMLVNTWQ